MRKQKINILFFLPNLNGGGAERVSVNIIRQLDKKKFNVILVLVKKTGVYLSLIPKHVTIYDLCVSKTIFSLYGLRNLLKTIKVDIVFSTLFRTHYILYFALLNIKKKPLLIMRSPNSPKLIFENKQINLLQKILLNISYQNADLVIAQTPEMKSEMIKFHNIQEEKIKILLNPIDKKLIDDKIKNTIYPFNRDHINIMAAGRITTQKGFDILIQSFAKVFKDNNKFRLFIIGQDDGEEEKLKILSKKLEIDKYVHFLGFQENPYKYFFYSDVYVLSSRWEGMPNTVLENLYIKKPVIATKCIPFLESIIINKKNGILVNVEDTEALAEAILNYKTINVNYTPKKIINDDFENVFVDVYNGLKNQDK